MADIVNLNRVRKQRARAERADEAARKRAAFGRTRADKERARDEFEKSTRELDGHRLLPPRDTERDDGTPKD